MKAWGIPYWQNQHRSRTEVDAPLSRLNSLLTLTSRTASGPQPDGSAELCSGDLNVHQLSFDELCSRRTLARAATLAPSTRPKASTRPPKPLDEAKKLPKNAPERPIID